MRQEQLFFFLSFEVTFILIPDTVCVHLYGVYVFTDEDITLLRKTRQYFYGAETVQEMNIFRMFSNVGICVNAKYIFIVFFV